MKTLKNLKIKRPGPATQFGSRVVEFDDKPPQRCTNGGANRHNMMTTGTVEHAYS
jgi:hypothetical protein